MLRPYNMAEKPVKMLISSLNIMLIREREIKFI